MTKARYNIKSILIGDKGVGKSSFVAVMKAIDVKMQEDEYKFDQDRQPTAGMDFEGIHVEDDQKKVSLEIRDISGDEKFENMYEPYASSADVLFFFADASKPLKEQEEVLVRKHKACHLDPGSPTLRILILTKSDLAKKTALEEKAFSREANLLARKLGASICENSNKFLRFSANLQTSAETVKAGRGLAQKLVNLAGAEVAPLVPAKKRKDSRSSSLAIRRAIQPLRIEIAPRPSSAENTIAASVAPKEVVIADGQFSETKSSAGSIELTSVQAESKELSSENSQAHSPRRVRTRKSLVRNLEEAKTHQDFLDLIKSYLDILDRENPKRGTGFFSSCCSCFLFYARGRSYTAKSEAAEAIQKFIKLMTTQDVTEQAQRSEWEHVKAASLAFKNGFLEKFYNKFSAEHLITPSLSALRIK